MGLLAVAAYRDGPLARRLRVLPVPAGVYRVGLWLAWAEHLRKALRVDRSARAAQLPAAERRQWVAQTVVLGFPSADLFQRRLRGGRR
jgi:hypothetical protein